MRKKWLCLCSMLVAVILCFSLTACGTGDPSADKFYNAGDPICVVDGAGRKVSFKETAQTIATSFGGAIDNYLYALGVGDRIVATNGHTDVDKLFFNPDDMKQVGKWNTDKEALAEVNPDIFLHGAQATTELEAANKVGVRSYGVGLTDFDDIIDNLTNLGLIFGVQERATYVINYLNSLMKLVEDRTAQIADSDRPSVLMLGYYPDEIPANAYTVSGLMLDRAGGKSIIPEEYNKLQEKPRVGLETIFTWNPDYIFMQDVNCEETKASMASDAAWKSMKAVQDNHVYEIPSVLDSWSKSDPSCYIGILYLSIQMYPDLYTDIDIKEKAVEFYHEVYGLDLTIEQIGVN